MPRRYAVALAVALVVLAGSVGLTIAAAQRTPTAAPAAVITVEEPAEPTGHAGASASTTAAAAPATSTSAPPPAARQQHRTPAATSTSSSAATSSEEPAPTVDPVGPATDSPMCVPDAPDLVPAPPACWEPPTEEPLDPPVVADPAPCELDPATFGPCDVATEPAVDEDVAP